MTYRIYLRVSTDDQAETRHGLHSQQDACIAQCGDNPYKVYSDEGVSGGTHIAEREGLVTLLREFEKGDVLLVAQRDRMGRDPIIVAVLEKTIEEKGGTVMSVAGEGTGSDSPSDILIRRVVDAISEYVRLNGKLRVKMALKAKKARGERTGGIPYGYTLDYSKLDAKGRPYLLVKNPAEQTVVEICRNQVERGTSLGKTASILTANGIFSRTGKPFAAQQIKRMVNYEITG